MKMSPQILVNVRYTAGSGDPLEHRPVKAVTAEVEAALGNRGRVLLRKSSRHRTVNSRDGGRRRRSAGD